MASAHFVFNPSAAGSLREALREAGSRDTVHAFFDDLSFGPIAPPDSELRCAWVEQNLGFDGWREVTQKSEEFWSAFEEEREKRVVWVSRTVSSEYAGFLACLDHVGGRDCDVIDTTGIEIITSDRSGSTFRTTVSGTGLLTPKDILRNNILDRACPFSLEQQEHYRTQWDSLKIDNASLRVVESGILKSAPMTYFDDLLVSFATPEWRKMAYLVGYSLAHSFDQNLHQVGDLVLTARCFSLIESGRLEGRGDLTTLHNTEVRKVG